MSGHAAPLSAFRRTRTFPPDLDQLALIRQFVEAVAADAPLDRARTFDLKVAVSEATTSVDLTFQAARPSKSQGPTL